ncbi:KN motif and ankyrin repeat domain-containing protein 2 [Frankliniella fusca]|uniref:KN motif and ankyrin repeat domain-containing protein 2 n=1 Tax=Frankliniella fusca TaxID=407009 RepID=A0AAE1H272_9NEOP|nr:KN motif and ankyrin repeat domain-containing protein 2 [Frankliniella fusca]
METACLRPQEPYGPGDGLGAGPGAALTMKHATFPRSARTERDSPRKPPTQQPSCDCCPYGYHIDLDFVRFCERLAAAGAGSPSHAATKARRRERRRQRQSMDVLLGLAVAPEPEQPHQQVWTIEQTLPQMPPSPVSMPAHASILVRDALQRAVKDFEDTLERSSPTPVPLSPAPVVPPRIPPRRYQIETTCSATATSRTSLTSSPGPPAAASTPVSARYLEQALDAGLWAAASASTAPPPPALQNIRAQIARSLERMRELEEEVKMIPVLKVQLSVLQEEKRKMLLNMEKIRPIKQNGTAHFDVLRIEEPVRSRMRPSSADGMPSSDPQLQEMKRKMDFLLEDIRPTKQNGTAGPKRRATRDIGVGCTVLTRDVGLMPPPPRLRSVGVGTEGQLQLQPQARLSLSATWTEDIPQATAARTAACGSQTQPQPRDTRGCQTEPEPAAARAERRDAGVQAQPMPVQRTHAGVQARPGTQEAGVLCAPRTRDAASSDHTVDDVLCARCCNVRKRTVGLDAAPWPPAVEADSAAAKRVCLSALGDAPAPAPATAAASPHSEPQQAAPAVPAAPAKPRTRSVGCGTAGDRINPFSVNRGVNTDPPVVAAAINRGVNTDAVPAPVKPATVSRATGADLRTPTSSRATNTDARAATAARATNTDPAPRTATSARATNTEPPSRRDAGTATTRRHAVDAGVSCTLLDPAAAPAPAPAPAPDRSPSRAEPGRGAPSPAPTLSPLPQSRIPRPQGSTTPTSPGPPPRRQFKRQDTYTKEPAPVVDITNKSPPPRRAHAEARAAYLIITDILG